MSKATIRIGSTKEFFARAQLVGRRCDRGGQIADSFTLSFEDPEDFLDILREPISQILIVLRQPKSIEVLADELQRNRSDLQQDIHKLIALGLVISSQISNDGIVDQMTYQRVHKDIVVELLCEDPELAEIYLETALEESHLPRGQQALANAREYVAEAAEVSGRKTRFQSIWHAIEATPSDAASMQARSMLMMAISSFVEKFDMNHRDAATLLGVSKKEMASLMKGKFNQFDLDLLLDMAARAGMSPKLSLGEHQLPVA
jgi:predicted XRE-type DNA-binding protein/predicted transcriptional regulator